MNRLQDLGLSTEVATKDERCDKHGEFVSRNVFGKVWTRCPSCAAEREATERQEQMEREKIARYRLWQQRLGDAGIPERFRDRTLESYVCRCQRQQTAHEIAVEYAANFESALRTGRSMIFCGKPGTGKTHLAVGIGLSAMQKNHTVLFSTVQRAIRRVRETWGWRAPETETSVIRLFTDVDLLILDEVGVQADSENEKNIIFDIMNERYERHKPTLMISNKGVKEVIHSIGERVYDRMRQGGGRYVAFDWESYRKGDKGE